MFYTAYPACDVIKIVLIIKQDNGWLVSFVLQCSETKHLTKDLTTDITITLKVLIDKEKMYCFPFNVYPFKN